MQIQIQEIRINNKNNLKENINLMKQIIKKGKLQIQYRIQFLIEAKYLYKMR